MTTARFFLFCTIVCLLVFVGVVVVDAIAGPLRFADDAPPTAPPSPSAVAASAVAEPAAEPVPTPTPPATVDAPAKAGARRRDIALGEDFRRVRADGFSDEEVAALDALVGDQESGEAARARVMGARLLSRLVRQNRPRLNTCYAEARRRAEAPETVRVDVHLALGVDGTPAIRATGAAPSLLRCIETTMSTWTYPERSRGSETRFPLVLSDASRADTPPLD